MKDPKYIQFSGSSVAIDEYGSVTIFAQCYCENSCNCAPTLSKEELLEIVYIVENMKK